MARRGRQSGDRPGERERQSRALGSPERGEEPLSARLQKLSDALDAKRSAEEASQRERPLPGAPGSMGQVLSLAFRVLSEFVAAVIVGVAIGWGIDRLAGTTPWFLIVFLLLGAAAGFWNVYRIGTEKPGGGES
ncbi:MAG TPA: AtpZ/AtpI family protein [Methylocella sp.]|nr:AtpZ/AtpI family protein [Methylocella sp.]